MDHTKMDQADLDSPCQGLSVRGLGFVVAFSVCSGIDLLCASTRGLIQLYLASVEGLNQQELDRVPMGNPYRFV